MNKKTILHDFYLCEVEPDEGSGYRVKQVNRKGKRVVETYISPEERDWFEDKDYVIVSREEYESIG